MKTKLTVLTLAILLLVLLSPVRAQTDEVKFGTAVAKITSVSAMRVQKAPQVTAEEVRRLKLGTVVSAVARSASEDTVAGKRDYWYRVNLSDEHAASGQAANQTGWVFGGLLLDYDADHRQQLLKQIIEDRLKAEQTEFLDRQEIYNLASSLIAEAEDADTRAEFELLKLRALRNWAGSVSNEEKTKSPYREWLTAHKAEIIENEFSGGYDLRTDLLWNLETKYHASPVADTIAWEAARNEQPSDCESDQVCGFFLFSGDIKYLNLHPQGEHAAEALNNLTEALTDEVIKTVNDKGGDKYLLEQRAELRKTFRSLRLVLQNVSAPEKTELVRKLGRVK